jgi:hypothetical protein
LHCAAGGEVGINRGGQPPAPIAFSKFDRAAVLLVVAVTVVSAGAALIECGFAWGPSDPVDYRLLHPAGKG